MMRKKYLVFSVLTVLFALGLPTTTGSAHSRRTEVKVRLRLQENLPSKNAIAYSPDRALTIADFTGSPDRRSHGVAATYSGIRIAISGVDSGGIVDVEIRLSVYFLPERSWMKKEGKNQQVLRHEQRHFDIAALNFCELVSQIQATRFLPDSWHREIKLMYQRQLTQLETDQRRYDSETAHGTLPERQAAYDRRIAAALSDCDCLE